MRHIYFLLAFLFSLDAFAGGLVAPFSGSRVTGFTQPSTIVEYDATMDHTVRLVDISGSNYFINSELFDSWTKANLTVSSNTTRFPVTNTAVADTLIEATDVAMQHSVRQSVSLVGGSTYAFSVYFKAINRTWISLYVGTDALQTFCDAATGTTGTTSSSVTSKNQSLGGGWYRCSMQFTATATADRDLYIYIADQDNSTTFNGTGQNSVYLCGAQLAVVDEWRSGPGIYHTTAAVTKPVFDIDQDGDYYVNISNSNLQDGSGRLILANNLYFEPYYEMLSHDALNILDGDFTITAVIHLTWETSYSYDSIFKHGVTSTNGGYFWFAYGWGAEFYLDLWNDGGEIEAYGHSNFDWNTAFVGQVVRHNNIITVYVDGNPGTPIDATGYGVDTTEPFYFAWSGSGNPFDNNIVYFRLDAAALSQEELTRQRDIFRGAFIGVGGSDAGSDFSRTLTDWERHTAGVGSNYLTNCSADVPRIGGDGGGVLIEERVTQLATYTDIIDYPAWFPQQLSMNESSWRSAFYGRYWQPDDSVISPTGLSPMVRVSESTDTMDWEHIIYANQTGTAGEKYTFSVYLRKIAGGRDWIWLSNYWDYPPTAYAYFNITDKYIGQTSGVVPFMEELDKSWIRIGITTESHTDDYWSFGPAASNGTLAYQGDGREIFWAWGGSLVQTLSPVSYVERTIDTTASKPPDIMTIAPWKINKGFGQGNPSFVMLFEKDICLSGPPCNLYTSEVGNVAFTANMGDSESEFDYPDEISHIASYTLGHYFLFDGHDDYMSLAHESAGGFYPTGDFTIVALVTPDVVTGTRTIFSTYAVGGVGGYRLYASDADVNFYTETDLGNTLCTKSAALTAKDPALITVSFTKGAGALDSACNIYVNGLSAGTSSVMRYPSSRDAGVGIAATAVGDDPFDGKIHYIGYHNVALTQAQHNANYAASKQSGVLPLKLGNSYAHKKLYLDFDSKCVWSSLSDIGSAREILSISGNTGTADSNTNQIRVYGNTDGKLYASIYPKDENTERYMSTAVHSDWNRWHAHKIMWDLEDLARSRFVTENVYATLDATMTGAKDIEFTDTLIRMGQNYAGTVNGNCKIRNLRLRSSP